jgi:Cu(I)/Ag(I) efflux system membrane protein CusA/SilA
MLLTGIKTPVGIKVFGPSSRSSRASAADRADPAAVPGTRSVYAERVSQGYFTDIRIDRDAIGRYGLRIEDVRGRHPVGARRRKQSRRP